MNDDKTSIDTDDSEILAKFRSLLNKYQNQGNIIASPNSLVTPVSTLPDDHTAPVFANKIPVLTEAVILHPAVIQPQPKRLTPIRQILDAALADALIEMDVLDRKALANALEARLANQIK
ncbi:hypothetical protein [Nitrosomonas sp.]|uniref:hypothetical protein n=1 Tax=Nitrosomonas sp. TaxID=42353 RepID=UPI00374C9E56